MLGFGDAQIRMMKTSPDLTRSAVGWTPDKVTSLEWATLPEHRALNLSSVTAIASATGLAKVASCLAMGGTAHSITILSQVRHSKNRFAAESCTSKPLSTFTLFPQLCICETSAVLLEKVSEYYLSSSRVQASQREQSDLCFVIFWADAP
jgi:hypothetical protein